MRVKLMIACQSVWLLVVVGPSSTHGFARRLGPRIHRARLHPPHQSNSDNNAVLVSVDELNAKLQKCTTGTQARNVLETALSGPTRRYQTLTIPVGSSTKGLSDGDLAIQTRANKKYKIMELIELNGDRDADRASLSVLVVFVTSTLAAVGANQNLPLFLPEIVRFVIVWLFCFAPLALVGYGIRDAQALQGTLVSIQRRVFPVYRRRMIQHEAGHFLMGHLLGWPIQEYVTNAMRDSVAFYPLADPDVGASRAQQLGFESRPNRPVETREAAVPASTAPYFSKEGRGRLDLERQSVFRSTKNTTSMLELAPQNEPTRTWPYRGFSDGTLDQLTVISVAGVCAEIIALGNAQGGRADFDQLQSFLAAAADEASEKDTDNRLRFALGFTMSVLRRNLKVLDDLATVMERDGTVAECIVAIESCRNDGLLAADYELQRRETFRAQGLGPLERILLGGDRTIDTLDDRFVEGKGGGARKQVARLTGDDPFYLAIAVALLFLLWASSGGLSLH